MVNGKGEGPPEKLPSLKPTMEMKDSVVKKATERKNEQTSKAEQELKVTSEEEQESLKVKINSHRLKKLERSTKVKKYQKNLYDSTSAADDDKLIQQRKSLPSEIS